MGYEIVAPTKPLAAAGNLAMESTFTGMSPVMSSQVFQSLESRLADLANMWFIEYGNNQRYSEGRLSTTTSRLSNRGCFS